MLAKALVAVAVAATAAAPKAAAKVPTAKAPKAPRAAFLYFCDQRRPEIKGAWRYVWRCGGGRGVICKVGRGAGG